MPAPTSATRHYRRLQRLQAFTIAAMRRAWRRMDPTGPWESQYAQIVGPQLTGITVAAQIAATREADQYVAEVLNELDFGPATEPGVVAPRSLAGVTGDGRPVESLLATSVGRARALSTTMAPQDALNETQAFIDTVTQTVLADAMRAAEDVAMAQRPWVDGWVRMVSPPCCSRCAVLSGKFYLFNEGFLRHPNCDCFHIPAPSDRAEVRDLIALNSPERIFESLSKTEQDRVFTIAGARAIREGADIGQVVNARRGMSRAQDGRLVTTEGTTRRGSASRSLRANGQRVRLMPETIFQLAGDDRAEAVRLLRVNGYLT